MPNQSDRRLLLRSIDATIEKSILDFGCTLDLESTEDDDDMEELWGFKHHVLNTRYLQDRSISFGKRSMAEELHGYTERQFKQEVRMDKRSFNTIVEMIENHPIFSNHSRRKQTLPWKQCLVAFKRFGTYGNANSLGSNGRFVGFSEGAVCKFVKRVTTAILSLRKEVVYWPNSSERSAIKRRIYNKYGLK